MFPQTPSPTIQTIQTYGTEIVTYTPHTHTLLSALHTFPHCLHFPFSVRRWTQWWCVVVCSRYWRTPTSRNVGLHAICVRSITIDIQLAWAIILHAEHFIRAPCFCGRHKDRVKTNLMYRYGFTVLWNYIGKYCEYCMMLFVAFSDGGCSVLELNCHYYLRYGLSRVNFCLIYKSFGDLFKVMSFFGLS